MEGRGMGDGGTKEARWKDEGWMMEGRWMGDGGTRVRRDG